MNAELIQAKFESLSRCLVRIRSFASMPPSQFLDDLDAQDIVMKNLERAVQVCVDVANHLAAESDVPPSPSMANTFRTLVARGVLPQSVGEALVSTVGFRNLAVHEYENLDYARVYTYINEGLGVFEDYARTVLLWTKAVSVDTR